MDLSQQDKDFIIRCIERGEPLPPHFRQSLFDDPQTVELIWPGKTNRDYSQESPQAVLWQVFGSGDGNSVIGDAEEGW